MPGEEPETMDTYEHEASEAIRDSEAASSAEGAFATSDGHTGPSGPSAAELAERPGISSADPRTTDDDGGTRYHEPQPPHTGSGPWPDPPQP